MEELEKLFSLHLKCTHENCCPWPVQTYPVKRTSRHSPDIAVSQGCTWDDIITWTGGRAPRVGFGGCFAFCGGSGVKPVWLGRETVLWQYDARLARHFTVGVSLEP